MKKHYLSIGLITFIVTIFLSFISCDSNLSTKNGWYFTPDGKQIKGKPILTFNDIDEISLDSVFTTEGDSWLYVIEGNFKPEAAIKFADYTEKNVGTMVAFTYDGKIITAPQINQKIEGGRFSITSISFLSREWAMEIYEEIKSHINK